MRLFSLFIACVTYIYIAAFTLAQESTTPDGKAPTTDSAPKAGTDNGANSSSKEKVRFDGEVLELASESNDEVQKVREFIPAGQTLADWTKLASIREYASDKTPAENVAVFEKVLKEQYPQSPSSVTQNPKTGEAMIDFVVWPEDGSFVEFNVFKYRRVGENGIVAEQYALREYKDPEGFLKGLKPVRERLVKLMADEGLKLDDKTNASGTNATPK